MKYDVSLSGRQRWKKSQNNLARWRGENFVSDEEALPSYDETTLWLSKYFRKGSLLEIGCRTGGLRKSRHLSTDIIYSGIDPLKDPDYKYDFNYECVAAEDLSIEGRCHDCILIRDSFDYFYDPAKALKNMMAILKPGGLLLISEGNHQGLISNTFARIRNKSRLLFSALLHKDVREIQKSQLQYQSSVDVCSTYPNGDLSKREIKNLLKNAGFTIKSYSISKARLLIVCSVRL
ncbi:class I SAM-dependent methyltransferase [Synechococcus sp. FGCU-3]|nr:class I SAM-dependent methyltransferase [Synechococcus sp. FGCU3]